MSNVLRFSTALLDIDISSSAKNQLKLKKNSISGLIYELPGR